MDQINKIELTVKIEDPGKLIKLQHNGDHAINPKISFQFGNRTCNFVATAYNETAKIILNLSPGSEVCVLGALYQEKFQDKNSGQTKSIDKIRINSIKQDDDFNQNNDDIF
ncbi:MAG: single-stranded DNA-binding protein [Deltaproteobacteria bacterium]|nr:single-stranded DNA-binding protein [Deltaproteobacteria bacterium]